MSRTRTAAAAVAVLALLTACSGSGSSESPSTTAPASSAGSSGAGSGSPTSAPDASSSPSGSGAAGSLVALQLCGTTLGYAAGAIAGVPADQLAKLKEGVASAQSKAGAGDAELVAASQAVVDAVAAGDQEAITSTGQTMGDLCGAGG
jgi:hypothetical protein